MARINQYDQLDELKGDEIFVAETDSGTKSVSVQAIDGRVTENILAAKNNGEFKGDKGDKGDKGEQGEPGIGVSNARINDDGELVFTYSDGTEQVVGVVSPEDSTWIELDNQAYINTADYPEGSYIFKNYGRVKIDGYIISGSDSEYMTVAPGDTFRKHKNQGGSGYNGLHTVIDSTYEGIRIYVHHDDGSKDDGSYSIKGEDLTNYAILMDWLWGWTGGQPGQLASFGDELVDYGWGEMHTTTVTDVQDIINKADTKIEYPDSYYFTAEKNTEYRYPYPGAETIEMAVPDAESSINNYIASLVFRSPETATEFTYPSEIVFTGDDCEDGVFIPQPTTVYNIIFWYDEYNFNAVVRGVSE